MPKKSAVDETQFVDLLCQALETEKGGVQIYEKAIQCAADSDLREEWEKYLEETKHHLEKLEEVFESLGLDTNLETPGRRVVKFIGESLLKAMDLGLQSGDPDAAQLVAAECVTHAETKDHANWELIGQLLERGDLENSETLQAAYDEIEDQEDEHLYHTRGWWRELALKGLGLNPVLPPPEEQKDVKTAIGAERAKQARGQMISKSKH